MCACEHACMSACVCMWECMCDCSCVCISAVESLPCRFMRKCDAVFMSMHACMCACACAPQVRACMRAVDGKTPRMLPYVLRQQRDKHLPSHPCVCTCALAHMRTCACVHACRHVCEQPRRSWRCAGSSCARAGGDRVPLAHGSSRTACYQLQCHRYKMTETT